LIRTNSMFAAIFTFHRASGLWVWPLLLLFAWSSVALRLDHVYQSVTRMVFTDFENVGLAPLEAPRFHPKLSWQEAYGIARMRMKEEAAARGFTIVRPFLMSHEPHFGFYRYQVQSSLDPSAHWCDTTVRLDSDTGELVDFWAPTGLEAGDTFTTWIVDLHFGWVGGLSFRILIFVVGLLGAVLVATGLLVWWRKLKARALRRGPAANWQARATIVALDVAIVAGIYGVVALLL
jgi:uncharacterized iron-regulated membrane protein